MDDKLLDVILQEIKEQRQDVKALSEKLNWLQIKVYSIAAVISVVGTDIKQALASMFLNKQ